MSISGYVSLIYSGCLLIFNTLRSLCSKHMLTKQHFHYILASHTHSLHQQLQNFFIWGDIRGSEVVESMELTMRIRLGLHNGHI